MNTLRNQEGGDLLEGLETLHPFPISLPMPLFTCLFACVCFNPLYNKPAKLSFREFSWVPCEPLSQITQPQWGSWMVLVSNHVEPKHEYPGYPWLWGKDGSCSTERTVTCGGSRNTVSDPNHVYSMKPFTGEVILNSKSLVQPLN